MGTEHMLGVEAARDEEVIPGSQFILATLPHQNVVDRRRFRQNRA